MPEQSVMELIERRREAFRQKSRLTNDAREAQRSSWIAEEYDALIAEIQDSGHLKHGPHPAPKCAEDPSEQWILGDQGQLGG